MTRRTRVAVLVGTLLVLTVASATAARSERRGPKPIRIGASISQTGVYAGVGQYAVRGYRLYVDLLNARGGLLGRPVQLIVYDDQSSPATAVRLYSRLISEDHVDVILGPYSSGITQAVAAVAEKNRRVMIDPFAAASVVFTDTRWNFQAITPSERYLASIADISKLRGYKTMALFVNNTPSTSAIAAALKARAQAFGIKIVYEQKYPNDASDYSSMVLAAKATRPDVVDGTTYVPDSVGLTRELNRQAVRPKLLAFSIGVVEPEYEKALGPLANGVIGNTLWWPSLEREGNSAFVAAYLAKYGGTPTYQVASGYAAMQVLEQAVAKTGSLDQTKLRDTIAAMRANTVTGSFRLDSSGRQVGYKSYLMQWQGGKARLVWPPKVAEAPLKLPYR
jgi:branched-chain amino acid transport system substrate-binding protein